MIMKRPGNNIAANSDIPKGLRECSGEPYRLKSGVNVQSNPGASKQYGNALSIGVLFPENNREAFLFSDASDNRYRIK